MGRYVFKLPDVGEGTAEAELVAWHVKVGDTVAEDQIIADIMTDKATVELTSPVAGKVLAAHGEPGQQLAVGSPLVEFEVEGAGNASEAPPPSNPAPQASVPLTGGQTAAAVSSPPRGEGDQPKAGGGAPAAAGGNFVFKLPDVGEGTAEAELVGWHVKVGDAVSEDQLLAEVMTDKATVELTSPVAGTVVALHGDAGQQLAVGGLLVSFTVEGKGNRGEAPPPSNPAPQASVPLTGGQTVSVSSPPRGEGDHPKPKAKDGGGAPAARTLSTRNQRPLASPAVRQRARDLGIELQFVPGSGPAGRIEHGDLDAWVASGGHAPSVPGASTGSAYERHEGTTETRIIGLRRKIAEKMAESVRRIPHITYVEEIDVTALEELRAHLNSRKTKDQPKLNVLPFIARAMVVALRDQPTINSHYDDEAGVLTTHAAVHIGIAAQTPNGLMVPVVRHAEARDPWDTALEIARVSGAAKDGSAKRDELSGSTITITSLGTLGGVVHTPIINHPEVAIVGPNKIAERVVVKDGQMVVRKMMNLSSSFDHRIVDGHDAAVFVQRIKGLLEHPATLWMN
ncbi:lipoamide acyltransferase component of branched-chain alpha-keto acid dehydrogenase complex [Brevundimonas denitrificans]|uniref:Dihydrolipoamide acetyltransferase component of pyruvate dehydrogenase complex n=1 Tax=Brevundimonas denitrificans TaxID=1443434 RepID=A0ABQ6BR37_9CAUL|nr:2-oxo acid dehydrogenase subunit E2 [Brevundimonas denitrificans]GLS02343.1 lipoamide acyltransferase component of branched-chain alpha-keto acid dehydrogenase complex [Brevundimonas denitrificans]